MDSNSLLTFAESRSEVLSASRLLDMVVVNIIDRTKLADQKEKARVLQETVKADASMRSAITSALPNFLVIKPELIANVVLKNLTAREVSTTEDVPASGFTAASKRIIPGALKYIDDTDVSTVKSANIPQLEAQMARLIHAALIQKSKEYSFIDISTEIRKIYSTATMDIAKVSAESTRAYISYTNIASKTSLSIQKYLSPLGVFRVSEQGLPIYLDGMDIAFISSNFDKSVSYTNGIIQTVVQDFLASNLSITKNTLKVGNLVHAGHTAAYEERGKNQRVLGINMPSSQIAQFRIDDIAARDQIELNLANIELNIETGIKFKKDFSETANILLDLQFSFSVSMEGVVNSDTHNKNEQKAIKDALANTAIRSLKDSLARKGKNSFTYILSLLSPKTTSSPSLKQWIESEIITVIKSGKSTKFKGSFTDTVTKVVTSGANKLVGKKSNKNKAVNKKRAPLKIQIPPKPKQTLSNLIQLQALLDSSLQDLIKANMGTGTRRDILNLRSGRFAESVKVERLSESRAGMITAFYSYMKNPYATFSAGGLQSTPQTRDPKLLIARSIRELAAQQVGNRLRSVVV